MTGKDTYNDIDVLARTLYGEAEANNEADAIAIANVIMNRVHYPEWPDTPAEVCMQPLQFSCWNSNDPNRARIMKAAGPWFRRCYQIAETAVLHGLVDPTKMSTHYYETKTRAPKWSKGKTPVYEVAHKTTGGSHAFYNNIDTPAPKTAGEALDQARPLHATGTIRAAQTGVIGTTAIATAAQAVDQLQPAIPLVQDLCHYAPWAIVALLAMVILYMVWRRIDDRRLGYR